MQLDHLFVLVERDAPEFGYFRSLGLVETYRRRHLGQGTENACYCFDNLFVELLWIDDPVAARLPAIARTRLYERSRWQSDGTCPFGIAWRDAADRLSTPPPCWTYSPPYLPTGMAIAVAEASDDLRQPMLFQSPGTAPPIDWPAERRGRLQADAGLGAITEIELQMPVDPCEALCSIAQQTGLRLGRSESSGYRLRLQAEGHIPGGSISIELPFRLPASDN